MFGAAFYGEAGQATPKINSTHLLQNTVKNMLHFSEDDVERCECLQKKSSVVVKKKKKKINVFTSFRE